MAKTLDRSNQTKVIAGAGWVDGKYVNSNLFYGTPEGCEQAAKDSVFPANCCYTTEFSKYKQAYAA